MDALQTDTPPSQNGDAVAAVEPTPRLGPIEEPDSWWVWLAYKVAAWTEGTVITPMKVVQARLPESLRHAYETQTGGEPVAARSSAAPPEALRGRSVRMRLLPASTEPGFLTGRYCDCCASCWEGASSKGCTSTQPSPSKPN